MIHFCNPMKHYLYHLCCINNNFAAEIFKKIS